MFRNRRNSRQVRAGCGFCGSHQLQLCQRRSCALGGSLHSLQTVVQAGNMARVQLARFGTCECNGRAGALSGPETAPSGSGGSVRCPRATVGSASALGTVCVASNGRRHAHIAPFAHRKKNVCNGRLDGRLSSRDHLTLFRGQIILDTSLEVTRGVGSASERVEDTSK